MEKGSGCFLQQVKSLLIMDYARSYLQDAIESFKRYNTECKRINGACLHCSNLLILMSIKHVLKRDGQVALQIERKTSPNKATIDVFLIN